MRILQISPYFHPYVGGQERYVRSLGRALVDRGHAVEILTSNFPKRETSEVIDGIQVRRFNFLCRPLNNPISFTVFLHLAKHFADFDIIHTHNEHAAVSLYSALVKSYSKTPLVVTCHGQLRFDNFTKDFIEKCYSKSFGAKVLRKADKVVAISNSDKTYIHSLRVPIDKITVIPNGVDLNRYNYQASNPLNMSFEGNKVVLFVGPLIKRKGPQVLIQAIPQIVKDSPDVIFLFAGGGNYKKKAEELTVRLGVDKYTRFTGYVTEEKLHSLYRHSNLFVLPSFSEALSYTILDAFVFSKPVVSTLIPCIQDYLRGSTLLVQPGDSEALAEAVILLLNEKKLAEELGAKGRRLVETHFSWDIAVNKMLETYQQVLNST